MANHWSFARLLVSVHNFRNDIRISAFQRPQWLGDRRRTADRREWLGPNEVLPKNTRSIPHRKNNRNLSCTGISERPSLDAHTEAASDVKITRILSWDSLPIVMQVRITAGLCCIQLNALTWLQPRYRSTSKQKFTAAISIWGIFQFRQLVDHRRLARHSDTLAAAHRPLKKIWHKENANGTSMKNSTATNKIPVLTQTWYFNGIIIKGSYSKSLPNFSRDFSISQR